ncbi:MAG: hypothetical protein WDK96_02525 [Candidatus Paceibacterota bacterium]|jgi:hypothetical protein
MKSKFIKVLIIFIFFSFIFIPLFKTGAVIGLSKNISKTKLYKVAIILINFSNTTITNNSASIIREKMYDVSVNNYESVAGFIYEATYGRFQITGKNSINGSQDIYGWYTIPDQNINCPSHHLDWIDEGRNHAILDGFNENGYDTVYYVFNGAIDCGWEGYAIGGNKAVSANFWSANIVHELGHNMGIEHANSYRCTNSLGNFVPYNLDHVNCQDINYGDPFDIMGTNWLHYSVNNKLKLGVVPMNKILNITTQSNGQYDIYPQENIINGVNLIKVYTEGDFYFTLEFRRPYGVWDNFLNSDFVVNGISIRQNNRLIDMHPLTSIFDDAPLAIGESYFDQLSGRTIQLLSVNTNKAIISISALDQINGVCRRHGPKLENYSSFNNGSIISFKIRNQDSIACSSSVFNIPVSVTITGNDEEDYVEVDQSVLLSPGESMQFQTNILPGESLSYGLYNHYPCNIIQNITGNCVGLPIHYNYMPPITQSPLFLN